MRCLREEENKTAPKWEEPVVMAKEPTRLDPKQVQDALVRIRDNRLEAILKAQAEDKDHIRRGADLLMACIDQNIDAGRGTTPEQCRWLADELIRREG